MLRRLTEHYNAFKDLNQTDWHRTIGDLIREKEKITGKSFKYCFVCCVKIHLQYCECSFEELNSILRTIPQEERSNYYNNFNRIRVYVLNGDSDTFTYTNGIFAESSQKFILKSGTFDIKNDI